jgi:hypothetical protein
MKRTFFHLLFITCLAPQLLCSQNVYFGNLHSHTSYSDGSGKPRDAFAYARNTAGLDFLAITEHNHKTAENGAAADRRDGILIAKDHTLYNGSQSSSLISSARDRNVNGQFVALYGQEFSSISTGNHINVFEVPNVINVPNGRFDSLVLHWLPNNLDSEGKPAIIQFNHPTLFNDNSKEYGADDFGTMSEWIKQMDRHASLIEILNGPAMTKQSGQRPSEVMEKDYLYYLNLGFHLAPTGNQDNHYETWGTATDARTAVVADELTKPKIMAALRNRNVYATEDKNLRIIFRMNGHLCGDIAASVPPLNSELDIRYSIRDDDEPDATYQIEVFSDVPGGEVARVIEVVETEGNTPGNSTRTIEDIQYTGLGQYLFFRVTQFDEDGRHDRAWTAPVWFDLSGIPSDMTSETFVASKNSRVYHVSSECRDAQRIKESNRIGGEEARTGRTLHDGCPKR